MVKTQAPPSVEHAGQFRRRIDEALRATLEDLGEGCPPPLREAMAYSLLAPGKRVRPLLVLMAAEACGGSPQRAMPAACAVEMVHAYSLIHDDLPAMDDDDLRRGRPTCHRQYGEAMAILAGDALLTVAFEVLARQIEPPRVAADCCAVLAQAAGACGMVGGQADDVAGAAPGAAIDALESLHNRKTGALLAAALRLGALVAEASTVETAALELYGRRLGLAFQVTDDLLDATSDEEAVGKRVGKDADRGKLTFPGLLGIEPSRRRARELVDEACRALAPLGPRGEPLGALAQYVLERNR